MGKPCDVCGGTGFSELIATCCQCKIAREHVYCMEVLLVSVPEVWFCETCRFGDTVTPKSVKKELFNRALESNTAEIVHSDMSRSLLSRRLIEEPGSSGRLKKQISLGTSRVKFIPIEKAVKMSRGAQNVELPSPSKLHPSSVRREMSRKAPIKFESAPQNVSRQKVKETNRSVPAGPGCEEICWITPERFSKSCPELKCKATCIEYKNQDICKKESLDTPGINFPGRNLCADAKPKNSVVKGCDLRNIVPKPEKNLRFHPVLDDIWCGSLEILDSVSCGKFYDGFRAHLPGKVHRKALEHSKVMPNVLPCTLLPCCNVWAEIFQNDSPTVNDMALLFSPGSFERSKQQYFSLLELLEMRDMALRSLIHGVNLLIFSSKRLNLDSYGSETESFLWGVYCPGKGGLAVPPLSS